jgi:hypothetical protein
MSDKPQFDKGDRAAIVGGRNPLGTRGEVFWVGENKFGSGMRYGLKGDDGVTYWLDSEEIGSEEGAPPAPPPPDRPPLDKGTRVKIVGTKDAGIEAEIFWTGASKYGPGMRYGVKNGEETYWVDEANVEVIDAPAGNAPAGNAPSGNSPAGRAPAGNAPGNAAAGRPASNGAATRGGGPDSPEEPPPAGPQPMADGPVADAELPPEAFDHNIDEEDIPF